MTDDNQSVRNRITKALSTGNYAAVKHEGAEVTLEDVEQIQGRLAQGAIDDEELIRLLRQVPRAPETERAFSAVSLEAQNLALKELYARAIEEAGATDGYEFLIAQLIGGRTVEGAVGAGRLLLFLQKFETVLELHRALANLEDHGGQVAAFISSHRDELDRLARGLYGPQYDHWRELTRMAERV